MDRYYVRYSAPNRSYSVIDRNRRNEFSDPFVVIPLVTEIEARRAAERLNAADDFEQQMARRVFSEVVTNNPNMR
jgi:hypothetical protein